MSCMLCCLCGELVDTDSDPDSLYVPSKPDEAVCQTCRNDENLPSEFEEPSRRVPNIDALIAAEMARPEYNCPKCDWDVDGCHPCEEHE